MDITYGPLCIRTAAIYKDRDCHFKRLSLFSQQKICVFDRITNMMMMMRLEIYQQTNTEVYPLI